MRNSQRLPAARLLIVTAGALLISLPASAGDFDALLAEIQYGQADAAAHSSPAPSSLSFADSSVPVRLQRAPNREVNQGFAMPPAEVSQRSTVSLGQPLASQNMIESARVGDRVDLETMFAAGETPATAAGHLLGRGHHSSCDGCGTADCGCRTVAAPAACNCGPKLGGCSCGDRGSELVCRPHVVPRIPTSTFYQAFRTSPCNANAWDGYQRPCGCASGHSRGECDCFDESKRKCGLGPPTGEILPPNVRRPCKLRPVFQKTPACDVPCEPTCDVTCDSGCDAIVD